jgi:uncharacterized small protein (DUF1192 family)
LGEKGSAQLQRVTIAGLDEAVALLTGTAEKLEPEIKELTNALSAAFALMQTVLDHSAVCRPFNEAERNALQQRFMALSKRTEAVEKNPHFVSHAHAVR